MPTLSNGGTIMQDQTQPVQPRAAATTAQAGGAGRAALNRPAGNTVQAALPQAPAGGSYRQQNPLPGNAGNPGSGGAAAPRPGWQNPGTPQVGAAQVQDIYKRWNEEGRQGASTRGVGQNELAQHQLTGMLSGDSKYIRDARLRGREEASSRGMLTGAIGAGLAERSAIQAAAPIATNDAQTYARTASENMSAQNQNSLMQQQMAGQLMGQEASLRAQMEDAALGRNWQSSMADTQRSFDDYMAGENRFWQSGENEAGRSFQGDQNQAQRSFEAMMARENRDWQGSQQDMQRLFEQSMATAQRDWQTGEGERTRMFESSMAELTRNWHGSQAELARLQERQSGYWNQMFNREGQMAQTLATIYGNPNLTPEQQRAAAANAQSMFTSLWNSSMQTFSNGIPDIFQNPYGISPGGGDAGAAGPGQPQPFPTMPPTITPPIGGPPFGGGAGGGQYGLPVRPPISTPFMPN